MARKNNVEDIEKELLGYMPRAFVLYYYNLVERSYVQYTSPLGHAGESGGSPKKRFNTHNGGLRDEAAQKEKRGIDRLLRSFVRDGGSQTKSAEEVKCASCTKRMGATWLWCAWCGAARGEAAATKHRLAGGQVVRVTPEPSVRAPRMR
ncbi:hypothetical protein SEA_TROJE_67 [Gordonia phage Troje]|uniref:Uncharacterized protein n=1 Tax=Gordonia phage Troje TaxID=2079282 RepID=A0A2K9VES2_9CAUD|nr:hypothetical protein FDJ27_gp67 [Gordonia phage Troje]AUV60772.1 hypothetical protein SEA_TROJE_67 [Gordonia phage Troje]QDM56343.1 hypothetical protein SEA_SWEATNTEARS_67 [Gordonia phage SweatNTears]